MKECIVALALLLAGGSVSAQMEVWLCIDQNGKREYKNSGITAACKKVDLPGAKYPGDTSSNSLHITRSPNGHFETNGQVNGVAVRFLVDTGASSVSVSDEVAREANLPAGRSITIKTANGKRPGRLIAGVPVSLGTLGPVETEVATGLAGGGAREALLGQSFLSHFDIQISGDDMILRRRQKPKQLGDF